MCVQYCDLAAAFLPLHAASLGQIEDERGLARSLGKDEGGTEGELGIELTSQKTMDFQEMPEPARDTEKELSHHPFPFPPVFPENKKGDIKRELRLPIVSSQKGLCSTLNFRVATS